MNNGFQKAMQLNIHSSRHVYGHPICFRRSCLGSPLTYGLSCILANEIRCKRKCSKCEYKNKLCDQLKSVTYTGTCSRCNVYGSNNRTRIEKILRSQQLFGFLNKGLYNCTFKLLAYRSRDFSYKVHVVSLKYTTCIKSPNFYTR